MKYLVVLLALVLAGCDGESRSSRGVDRAKDTRLHWDAKWEAQTICARKNMLFENYHFFKGEGGEHGFRAACRDKSGTIRLVKRTD